MVWKDLPEDPKPPHRQGIGTKGRQIALKANYYEVVVKNWNKELVHYDVVIQEPKRGEEEIMLSKARKIAIFETLKSQYPGLFKQYNLAYDGMKSAVSTGVISQFKDGSPYKVEVTNNSNKKNTYIIILKVVNKTNLKELWKFLKEKREFPATVFQLIEIMFRHTPSVKYLSIGQNSFYSFGTEFGSSESIGSGMIAGQGFFASLRPAQWKNGSLLLNVDVAHAAFYKEQPVLEFMTDNSIITVEDLRTKNLNKPLEEVQRRRLKEALRDLKVRVIHARYPRTYKIIDILDKGADKQQFKVDENKYQTVLQYFKEAYPRFKMQYEKLNLIRAAPDNKTVYIPIECCVLARGQKVKRKQLGSTETAKFISFTAQPPNKRLNNINNIIQKNRFSNDPMMQALGFTIMDKPLEFTGRVLPPPRVDMVDPKKCFDPNPNNRIVSVTPYLGKWDVRDKKFFESADIKCWEVLCFDDRLYESVTMDFVSEIIKLGRFRGMNISKPGITSSNPKQDPERILQHIKSQKPNLEMLLVILPAKTTDLYAKVKIIGDRTIQTVTQCVLSANVRKKNSATIGNLLFKINAKMGGINNSLGREDRLLVLDRPVMIMGADVNHPPASDRSATPSVAAVVASMDKHAFKYAVEVRHQTSREEMIEKLKEMTKSLLITFYRTTGCKPERIVMYRDGVSESQFLKVLKFEMNAMREACLDLQGDYKPGITFIVVQKRHHTRFFPVDEREGVGKNKNVPPGTVVDTAVTHPDEIDFFLCSHEGIQGTSKPTHYRVLWDDNDFTMDQLQCFSYAVCHLYARCARSVSIPTPAYYAHWAAFRGKVHLQDICGSENRSRLQGEEKQQLPDNVLLEAVRMDGNFAVNKKMYFL